MRDLIEMINLLEKVMVMNTDDAENLPVLVTPHRNTLLAFTGNNQHIVRGLCSDDAAYFWCAFLAYHYDLQETLKLTNSVPLVVSDSLKILQTENDWEPKVPYGQFQSGKLFFMIPLKGLDHPMITRLFPDPIEIERFA